MSFIQKMQNWFTHIREHTVKSHIVKQCAEQPHRVCTHRAGKGLASRADTHTLHMQAKNWHPHKFLKNSFASVHSSGKWLAAAIS